MTVCIAAICDNGKAAVVCADREVTVAGFSLEFEHHESKIDRLTDQCVALSAGETLLAYEIIEKTKVAHAANNQSIQRLSEGLRDVYMEAHLERAERVILRPRGLTMQEFKAHAAQMPVQGYLNLDTQIFNFGLNAVEFLVAGLDDSGAHLFRIYYNGVAGGDWMEWCDKLGYRAIGSGSSHATIWLSLEGQHRGLSVPDTLFNLYCAKKTAESAPGVGRETDLFFLTANGVERVPEPVFAQFDKVRDSTKKAPDGDELQRIYEKRNG